MSNSKILTYIIFHIGIGLIFYLVPFFSSIYSLLVFGFGLLYISKNKNKNNEALLVAAYVVGLEVFLRMTNGFHINEYGKYTVIIHLFVGMLYQGFSKKSWIYWVFIILLMPGIGLSFFSLSADVNLRKAIAFNLSGPICLGFCSVYCFDRKITFQQLLNILFFMGLPILSILTYLFFKTPSVKEVITGTSSNFATSGGFGPNQVSTVLGLGMFVFFALFVFWAKSLRLKLVFGAIIVVLAYRGLVTFSRGGTITGFAMMLVLLLLIFYYSNAKGKLKLSFILIFFGASVIGVWSYSVLQTKGLIANRYANEDALGRKKVDRLGGREQINKVEIQAFLDNPIMGIGVGKSKSYISEAIAKDLPSHNELTRMLSEHGMLGVFAIIILLLTPFIYYINNKYHLLLIPFFIFWFLTIQHAAMRIAAPAFIYALSLLKVQFDVKENIIHR